MSFVERRRSQRIEIQGRLDTEIVASVAVREISLGGLSFSSPTPFPIGVVHKFRLTLGDGTLVVVRGRILRTEERVGEDGSRFYICGVQFLDDDSPEDVSSIGELMDRIK
jgi:PilZ domain